MKKISIKTQSKKLYILQETALKRTSNDIFNRKIVKIVGLNES